MVATCALITLGTSAPRPHAAVVAAETDPDQDLAVVAVLDPARVDVAEAVAAAQDLAPDHDLADQDPDQTVVHDLDQMIVAPDPALRIANSPDRAPDPDPAIKNSEILTPPSDD